jgi:hypothetical protein
MHKAAQQKTCRSLEDTRKNQRSVIITCVKEELQLHIVVTGR